MHAEIPYKAIIRIVIGASCAVIAWLSLYAKYDYLHGNVAYILCTATTSIYAGNCITMR